MVATNNNNNNSSSSKPAVLLAILSLFVPQSWLDDKNDTVDHSSKGPDSSTSSTSSDSAPMSSNLQSRNKRSATRSRTSLPATATATTTTCLNSTLHSASPATSTTRHLSQPPKTTTAAGSRLNQNKASKSRHHLPNPATTTTATTTRTSSRASASCHNATSSTSAAKWDHQYHLLKRLFGKLGFLLRLAPLWTTWMTASAVTALAPTPSPAIAIYGNQIPSLPEARFDMEYVVVGDYLHVLGGFYNASDPNGLGHIAHCNHWVLFLGNSTHPDMASSFEVRAELPSCRALGTASYFEFQNGTQVIFYSGGASLLNSTSIHPHPHNTSFVYHIDSDIWYIAPDMPTPLDRFESETVIYEDGSVLGVNFSGTAILMVGGTDGKGEAQNETWAFFPEQGVYVPAAPLPDSPRRSFGMTSDGTVVVVAGGVDNNTKILDSVAIYYPGTNEWLVIEQAWNRPRRNFVLEFVDIGGELHLVTIGGRDRHDASVSTVCAAAISDLKQLASDAFDAKNNVGDADGTTTTTSPATTTAKRTTTARQKVKTNQSKGIKNVRAKATPKWKSPKPTTTTSANVFVTKVTPAGSPFSLCPGSTGDARDAEGNIILPRHGSKMYMFGGLRNNNITADGGLFQIDPITGEVSSIKNLVFDNTTEGPSVSTTTTMCSWWNCD